MKKVFTRSVLLLFLIACSGSLMAQKKAVKKCFEMYKQAILSDKGETAIDWMDSRTIKYYSDILETTKNADSSEVEQLSKMDKIMVLTIRHRASREQVLGFDGRSLLVYAIKEGMVGKDGVAGNELGEIIVEGDFAKGQLVAGGQKTPFYFHFYKEEGAWKIDITSLFTIGELTFRKMIEESGMPENEYLFMLLEMVSGKKPSSSIWNTIN